ncbi:DUF302 domain-containing protein [Mycolicibacterium komossense]|jgi:uncharacterized protein (DUF302 family)|uniref:DUF302 domain-containing protein n=1 Tax=Mycolicibacterium komossense TaxID=1779 RepID=A0ABT3CFA9_9MYCO|nr:DUF302 domain-containing protein [Mycolicibacterium komossense]MCV7228175.1 DUF302 domain-containing protein [Mycolicibacterium komossense]
MSVRMTKTEHVATRLDIATGVPFDAFCTALDAAAPKFRQAVIEDIVNRGGSWDEVLAAVAENAPHGLMVFASIDGTALMRAAGHQTRAIEYLIGNHTIAERMFRHNPLALLYAPLRMLVHSDDGGNAVLSLDQPSTLFGSLGHPAISAVGRELDDKVRHLLTVMGVDVRSMTAG